MIWISFSQTKSISSLVKFAADGNDIPRFSTLLATGLGNLSEKTGKIDYKYIQLLSRAHHNLAVAYAKKTWYDDAIKESQKAFELIPTNDNRQVMELIQKKISAKSKNKPNKISANQ